MARSTQQQKAQRLNAAHALLRRGVGTAAAARSLSRTYGLSARQAYRYLAAARALEQPMPPAETKTAVRLRIPATLAAALRRRAAASGLTPGEIVSRALAAFLAAGSDHG